MTLVVLPVDPPREGLVLPRVVETAPVSDAEAVELYQAMVRDVVDAAARSGGGFLVNYRPSDLLPPAFRDGDPESEVRDLVESVDAVEDPRLEVQVGSSYGARVGNAVTHLLETEEQASVAVADPTAPTLTRSLFDSAAMKLRRHDAVLSHGERGRVAYAGFGEAVDFEDAFEPPAVTTLSDRCVDAGLSVDFVPGARVVETGSDLASLIALLRARARAGRIVPTETLAAVDRLGLDVEQSGDALAVVRRDTDKR